MNVNKGGDLFYKCRNCKKVYNTTHVPDIQLSLIAITNDWKDTNLFHKKANWIKDIDGSDMFDIHNCNENDFGIADLIKGTLDKTDA